MPIKAAMRQIPSTISTTPTWPSIKIKWHRMRQRRLKQLNRTLNNGSSKSSKSSLLKSGAHIKFYRRNTKTAIYFSLLLFSLSLLRKKITTEFISILHVRGLISFVLFLFPAPPRTPTKHTTHTTHTQNPYNTVNLSTSHKFNNISRPVITHTHTYTQKCSYVNKYKKI